METEYVELYEGEYLDAALKRKYGDKNIPTNGPLTLEELTLMTEPTPVWWDWVQGWVLARKGMITTWSGRYHSCGGLRGDFYRRPPEGEEETP